MKPKNIIKSALAVVLMIGIAALIAPQSKAQGTIASRVTITGIPITVTGLQAVAFGLVEAPTGVPDTWLITACDPGGLLGPAGNKDVFPLDHSRGEFAVVGSPNLLVKYTVSVLSDFVSPDLALTVNASSICPTSPDALDINGDLSIKVGGTVLIQPGIPAGSYNDAEIEMIVNYN